MAPRSWPWPPRVRRATAWVAAETSTGKLWLYPGTASPAVLDRRVEIGASGWNRMTRYAAADYTGDGRADLAAVDSADSKLYLYVNTGQSGLAMFSGRTEIGAGPWNGMDKITSGDFDRDGRSGLVAVETGSGATRLHPLDGTCTGEVAAHTSLRLIG